ncbi:endolytic transglycosylase MltG [Aestuariivirga sp.]|uniref:endolytic transglycosylase MltG n=1 Tax=Aestuariivirga sp. TaxID=2650926 RepID=UPI0025C1A5C7|nr:endolytic transglycosylase MltG [Aestuariivirga sp.]MCA3554109.1 endolytic transglycosylase MltG [Aestuariivirga sp.]
MKLPQPRPVRQRRSAISRVLGWTFLLLFAGAAVSAFAGFYAYSEFTAPGPLAADKVVIVEPGQSVTQIGEALQRSGVVSNGRLFALMAQITGQRARLKAGEYAFAKGATMAEAMALIASGKAITYKLSIPEGFTSRMAADRVNASEVLTGEPVAEPAEGSILPDTYVFRRGMTRQKLVQDMQDAQAKLLAELWAKRKPVPVIATPEQAVTLASIVEKETARADERPVIASVFINRLGKGMRLQSDPTIIYGIAGGKGRLDRALSKADIDGDTPYNTYRIEGLPPGPIANPGRAALEAVLNPEETDKLYFVADGSGGHAFAATLEEHNRNVKAWRQIASAPAAAADTGEPDAPARPAADATAPATVPAADAPSTPATPATPATQAPLADVVPGPEATVGGMPGTPSAAAEASAPETAAPKAQPAAPAAQVPKPQAKSLQAAASKPAARATPGVAPKPGTVLVVDGQKTVIPRLRP